MKLCFCTLACPDWDFEQIIACAKDVQVDGIDFRGIQQELDITKLDLFTRRLDQTLDTLAAHNLELPCLNSSIRLMTTDADVWQQALDECRRYARLAEKTATPYLRIFGGAIPDGMSRSIALKLAQTHLRQIVAICKDHRCQPLLETHDDWAISARILELLDKTAPDEAGVLWDIEHPYRQGEPLSQTADALQAYIKHVQFKDSIRQPDGTNLPTLLGDGELPLRPAYHELKRIGYDLWISLETEKRWYENGPEPQVSIPQFVTYMRSLCQAADFDEQISTS